MPNIITYYETIGKPEIACGRIDLYFAARNFSRMEGNRLRLLRDRRGMKARQIAERLGVSTSQISRWETGKDSIPSKQLGTMAEAYQAEIGELFQAPSAFIPTEEEMEQLLHSVQRSIPSNLPFGEWPRVVAAGLRIRLARLLDDRASADDL